MSAFAYVAEHLSSLLAGSTLLLLAGTVAMLLVREPAYRQRIGEAAVLAAALLIAFSLVPLPRPGKSFVDAMMSRPAAGGEERPVIRGERKEPARESGESAFRVEDAVPREPARAPVSFVTAPPASPKVTAIPTSPPARAERQRLDLSRLLALVWIGGAALIAAWILVGASRLARLLRRARPAPDWVMQAARNLDTGMGRFPRIVVTRAPRLVPFCLMLPRPTIVLPKWLAASDRSSDLEKVLHHEFVHLRRRDGVGRNLLALALPLFWFHPLFWWVRSRVRLAAELIADDEVGRTGDHAEYARQLVRLAERDTGFVPSPLGAVGVLGSKSEFYRRIEMLMRSKSQLAVRCNRAGRIALCCGTALSVLLVTSLLGAEPPAQDKGALQQEIQQLQDQNHRLRAELDEMRQQLTQLGANLAASPNVPEVPSFEVVVKEGDTLASIWREHFGNEVDMRRLRRLNPGVEPERLAVGQVILLPDRDPERAPGVFHQGLPSRPRQAPEIRPDSPLPAPEARPESTPIGSVASPEILDLVTRMIDLEGEIQIAELELNQGESAHEASVLSERELTGRRLRLASLTRKHELLRGIALAELEVARSGLGSIDARVARSRQLVEVGFITEGDLNREVMQRTALEARIRLLEGVL
ncbi:MAG: M56 family metallopeptidase [Planctomycetota bacterium]